jgi:hypothetical protein
MPKTARAILVLAMALVALGINGTVLAGPPFFTDDPEPVELHHWEAYLFSTWDAASDATAVGGPAVEFNLGAAPELQLHLVVPYATNAPAGGVTTHGLGDIEVGAKYRFLEETDHRPQVGTFPMVELPTGNAHRGLGNGQLWMRVPLWIQKSWGPWTTYGGVGYTINRAPGARSYPFAGWLLQRDLNGRLTLGGEIFTHGADAEGGRSATILNGGGYYNFNPGFSLLFSAGRTVQGEPHTVAYLGLYWTWGR